MVFAMLLSISQIIGIEMPGHSLETFGRRGKGQGWLDSLIVSICTAASRGVAVLSACLLLAAISYVLIHTQRDWPRIGWPSF